MLIVALSRNVICAEPESDVVMRSRCTTPAPKLNGLVAAPGGVLVAL